MSAPVLPETEELFDAYGPGPVAETEEFADGVRGSAVFGVSVLVAAGCVGANWMFTGGLSFFFDLCFVVLCLSAAMVVDTHDAFSLCVLPPLVFGLAVGGLSLADPGSLTADATTSHAFLVGLAAHAGALVAGYALALAALAVRWVGRDTPGRPAADNG